MKTVEFIANPAKTFSAVVYDEGLAQVGTASNIQDTSAPGLYRFSVNTEGVVYVVATATNLKVLGWADLDTPGGNEASSLADTFEEATRQAVIEFIRSKSALIGSGSVALTAPVTTTGKINPLTIGDDYLSANGRSLRWVIDKPVGFELAGAKCYFGGARNSCSTWNVEGEIEEVDEDQIALVFELPRDTTRLIKPGNHDWSVAVHDSEGVEITTVQSGTNSVTWSMKFTKAIES